MEIIEGPHLVKKGAEADIYLGRWFRRESVAKCRVKKKYRVPQLDLALRTSRTVQEAQLIHEAKKAGVPTPALFFIDQKGATIIMEFVKGEKIKDIIGKMPYETERRVFRRVGKEIAMLHRAGIIHGDLTTSNMILTRGEQVVFIDFGLGSRSEKVEDRGVDLHLLKRALQSTHHKRAEDCFQSVLEGYRQIANDTSLEVIKRAYEIERRGRYAIR